MPPLKRRASRRFRSAGSLPASLTPWKKLTDKLSALLWLRLGGAAAQ